MDHTVPAELAARQAPGGDHDAASRSHERDQYLAMLRRAIEDSGWKLEALAEYLQIDRAHLSRMLAGEKPFRIEHLVALPDDIEALFERRRAEHFGLIVVDRVDEGTALQQLASGVLNLALSSRLPAKAATALKADLPTAPAKARVR